MIKLGDVLKDCLHCGAPLEVKARRDITRKKYCSHGCRQKQRYIDGDIDMKKLWDKANTPEANAKKVRRGSANGRYLNNRNEVKHRRRPETNEFREKVFDRDEHKCVWCGSEESLIADHIVPYADDKNLRYDVKNGRTLCAPCHKKTDTYGWNYFNKYKRSKDATLQK